MKTDALYAARKRPVVIYHRFIKDFSRTRSALFCFFEGDDSKYYEPRITFALSPADCYYYNCGGKNSVIRILGLIAESNQYQKAWTCFFVDRDYDDANEWEGEDRVYVTPCYSIENLYVTDSVFKRILKSEFNSKNLLDHETEAKLTLLYHRMMTKILNSLDQINWWLKGQRNAERKNGSVRLEVGDMSITDLISVGLDYVRVNYCYLELSLRCREAHRLSVAEISEAKRWFNGGNKISRYRGKWSVPLFVKHLNKIIEDLSKSEPSIIAMRIHVKLKISGNYLSELSQYADTPECLREFLNVAKTRRYYLS